MDQYRYSQSPKAGKRKADSAPLEHAHKPPSVQRTMSGLRPSSVDAEALDEVPPIVTEVLQSPGQPLDPAAQAAMEGRLGHDFSRVRVYTDGRAAASAQAVDAQAYTVGNNIVFGAGRYAPSTSEGSALLVHELRHVMRPSASLLRKPADAAPTEKDELKITPHTSLSDAKAAVANRIRDVMDERISGIEQVHKEADRKAEPKFDEEILKICALVALAAVTDGIGEFVAGAAVGELATEAVGTATKSVGSELLRASLKEMLKSAVAKTLEASVERLVDTYTTGVDEGHFGAREAFFELQKDALKKVRGSAVEDLFLNPDWGSDHPRGEVLSALRKERDDLIAQERRAKWDQYTHTAVEWAAYQASTALGSTAKQTIAPEEKPGTNLAAGDFGPGFHEPVPGVLILDVNQETMHIFKATISGLRDPMINRLKNARKPIANLGVPFVAYFPALGTSIGENEGGTVFIDESSPHLLQMLHLRAHPWNEVWGEAGPSPAHIRTAAYEGARLILEQDLGHSTLQGLGGLLQVFTP